MENPTVKELLEAGAHFGHHTSYWHPNMNKYIFTRRNGIHIIDLEQTVGMLAAACEFVRNVVASGETVLFVGTKRQAQQVIEEEARRSGMFYVNQRWLGGMLTNFATIQARIDYLVRLEDAKHKGELERLSKKERSRLEKKISHLNEQMGGFKEMTSLPRAIFIADPLKDRIALTEARKVEIPIIAIVDTNCDPERIEYPIPANDDAIKAIKLICGKLADAAVEGHQLRISELPEEQEAPTETEEPVEILGSYTFEPGEQ